MKRHVFEQIEKDETFGPIRLPTDEHTLRGYAFAVEDYSSIHFETPQKCGPVIPSAFLAKKLLHIFMSKYDPQGVSAVHLKDDIEFVAPAAFGDEITLSARYSDVFVKKGRGCVVLDGEARNSTGALIVKHRSIEMVPSTEKYEDCEQQERTGLSQRRVDTIFPEGALVASSAVDARAGMVLPLRSRTIHQDQMSVFVGANEGWKNLHTDIEIARAAGFERTIMSGMIQACWFTHLMTDFFGKAYLSGGKLGITFLKNVASEETVQLNAVVRNVLDDGTLEVEFWSTNARGEPTAVGWATGRPG